MSNVDNPRRLSEIVGQRLRRFREAKDLRQEDVATAARGFGLNWGRSSVAALEGGNRDLSIAEVALLPSIIRTLGGWDEALIPTTENIRLNESVAIPAYSLQSLLLNLFHPSQRQIAPPAKDPVDEDVALGAIEVAPKRSEHEKNQSVARTQHFPDYLFYTLWPDAKEIKSVRTYSYYSGWEILHTIASRLNTTSGRPDEAVVLAFSLGLWGRSPGEERDARVDESRFETKRALQSARGHVTRILIEELQSEIDARWPEVQKLQDALDRIIDDPKKLDDWSEMVDDLRRKRYSETTSPTTAPSPRPIKGKHRRNRRESA